MKKSELTSFVKEEIISALKVEVKEELGVSRKKLSDFYLSVGGRDFAAAIIDITDENVLDSLVAALNFREKDGTSYYGSMGEDAQTQQDIKDTEELTKAIDDLAKAKKEAGIEENEEPSDKEIKKNKGLAKAAEELAQLTKQMKSLARKYKEAEGEEKEKIVADLKKKTKLKKELEAIINK